MKTITVAELEAYGQEFVEEVRREAQEIVIEHGGKAVAKLVPCPSAEDYAARPAFGRLRGETHFIGDIVNPIPGVWDADE